MDNIKLELVVAQIINFWILFFIFYYFLGDKIVKVIQERRKHLKASEQAEDTAKEQIKLAKKEADAILQEARTKAMEIEKTSEELAKNSATKILQKAEKEADYALESGRNMIEKEQLDMENSMKSKVLNLALKLNQKVFKKETANKDFLEKELDLLTK